MSSNKVTMKKASNIMLVRPSNFKYNEETALSNTFQKNLKFSPSKSESVALKEFDEFAKTLKDNGVAIHIFQDTLNPQKPDAIFPNNWISFHRDGRIILYPMQASNRQYERRDDILEKIKDQFSVKEIIDLAHYEKDGRYLEGTGSVVFDHQNKIAYACLSNRTDEGILKEMCEIIAYKPFPFHAYNEQGKAIYHTNVMMCVGESFATVCLESISDENERRELVNSLEKSGHKIVDISYEQMNNFAGNMLEISSEDGRSLVGLSQSAYNSLNKEQKSIIEESCKLVPLKIDTIETIGGGSARCMMAEIFLPEK